MEISKEVTKKISDNFSLGHKINVTDHMGVKTMAARSHPHKFGTEAERTTHEYIEHERAEKDRTLVKGKKI
jgi:hypothetical protein